MPYKSDINYLCYRACQLNEHAFYDLLCHTYGMFIKDFPPLQSYLPSPEAQNAPCNLNKERVNYRIEFCN